MLKKWGMLLALLCALCAALCALAEPQSEPLGWEELNTWAESCLERARSSRLLNDPTAEEALTEDGYALVYDFATLYMSQPTLADGSLLMGVLVVDVEQAGPRDVDTASAVPDALSLFRNDNPMLVGGRTGAVLYAVDEPGRFLWGYIQRDGQRIGLIQYAVHEELADGVTDAGLLLTCQDGGVTAIRVYGLQNRISALDLAATREFVEVQAEQEDYERVLSSLDGDEVSRFEEADLAFAGLNLLTATPASAESALGQPLSDEKSTDEDGAVLRAMRFEDCELVFSQVAGGAERLTLFSCEDGEMEGPRAIRLGDLLTTVMSRFAAETTSGGTLYGTAGTAPCGTVEFGEDNSAVLRYSVPLRDGRVAVLLMNFEQLELREYYILLTEPEA